MQDTCVSIATCMSSSASMHAQNGSQKRRRRHQPEERQRRHRQRVHRREAIHNSILSSTQTGTHRLSDPVRGGYSNCSLGNRGISKRQSRSRSMHSALCKGYTLSVHSTQYTGGLPHARIYRVECSQTYDISTCAQIKRRASTSGRKAENTP